MKYQILNSEVVETSTGKTYIKAELTDKTLISVWPDYSQYEQVEAGAEVEGIIIIKGKYKNLIDDKSNKYPPKQTKVQQITQFQANKAEYIKQAQERTQEGIAWFNSTNSAISLLAARNSLNTMSDTEIQAAIRLWREWFLDEFKNKPPF